MRVRVNTHSLRAVQEIFLRFRHLEYLCIAWVTGGVGLEGGGTSSVRRWPAGSSSAPCGVDDVVPCARPRT